MMCARRRPPCTPTQLMKLTSSTWIRAALCASAVVITAASAVPRASASTASALLGPDAWINVDLDGLDGTVFALALESAASAVGRGIASMPSTLTVIDYSRPSTQPRLWVFDVRTHELLFRELVS